MTVNCKAFNRIYMIPWQQNALLANHVVAEELQWDSNPSKFMDSYPSDYYIAMNLHRDIYMRFRMWGSGCSLLLLQRTFLIKRLFFTETISNVSNNFKTAKEMFSM